MSQVQGAARRLGGCDLLMATLLRCVACLATLVFSIYLLSVVRLPLEKLIKFVPDDAFYYLKIAQNVVAQQGVTFDGLSPTSGVHPLFLLLLLPIAALFERTPETAIRVTILLCGLLFFACALVLKRIIRMTAGRDTSVIAFAAALTAPSLLLVSVGGLETSLSLLLLLTSFLFFLQITSAECVSRLKVLLLGVLTGAAILARTDCLFLVVACILGFAIAGRASRRLLHWRTLSLFLGPVAFVTLALVIWSVSTTGVPFQSSGLALTVMSWRSAELAESGVSGLLGSSWELARDFATSAFDLAGFPVVLVILMLIALLCASAISELVHVGRLLSRARPLLPLLLHSAFLVLFYALWLRHFQLWYLVPASVAIIAFCSLLLGAFSESVSDILPKGGERTRRILKASFAASIIIAGVIEAPSLFSTGLYPWQPEILSAVFSLQKHVPADAKVGSFNAGIAGFFLNANVVNLDGVVNSRVLPHLASGTLDKYMAEAPIDCIVDYQYSLFRFATATTQAGYPGFELVSELPGTWNGTNIWVCRRRPGAFVEPSLVRLVSGFYPAERWLDGGFDFRWSMGNSSSISVEPSTPDVDLELVVLAFPLELGGRSGQSVTVSLNDRTLGSVNMVSGWREYVMSLPAGTLEPGENIITFTYGHTLCPATDCDWAPNDRRRLAVAFREFRCQRKNRSMAIAAPSSLFLGTSRSAASLTSSSAFSTAIPTPAFCSKQQSETSSPIATTSSGVMPAHWATWETACHFSPLSLKTSSALTGIVKFLTMCAFNAPSADNPRSAS